MRDESGTQLKKRLHAAANTVQTALSVALSPEKAALASEALKFLEDHSAQEFLSGDRTLALPLATDYVAIAERALRTSHLQLAETSLERAQAASLECDANSAMEMWRLYHLSSAIGGYVQLRALGEAASKAPEPKHLAMLSTIVENLRQCKLESGGTSDTRDQAEQIRTRYYLMGCANMLGDTNTAQFHAKNASKQLENESLAALVPNTITLHLLQEASKYPDSVVQQVTEPQDLIPNDIFDTIDQETADRQSAQTRAAALQHILPNKKIPVVVERLVAQENTTRQTIARVLALANGDRDKYRLAK